ncbi:hypothetical protein PENSPDRAFT_418250 [Peniophora sp. CONT]|nr:hypothetical protein PENSPDRAFT_418250 [Peniophora sp. CONT]
MANVRTLTRRAVSRYTKSGGLAFHERYDVFLDIDVSGLITYVAPIGFRLEGQGGQLAFGQLGGALPDVLHGLRLLHFLKWLASEYRQREGTGGRTGDFSLCSYLLSTSHWFSATHASHARFFTSSEGSLATYAFSSSALAHLSHYGTYSRLLRGSWRRARRNILHNRWIRYVLL